MENHDYHEDTEGEESEYSSVGDSSEPTIGIDLGTTFCCVAVFNRGRAEVIANEQGSRITPSTVAFTSRERLVGEEANFQRIIDPANAIYNSKRFIGRLFSDPVVEENKDKYPFQFRGRNNKVNFQVEHLGNVTLVTPEEIGAALLEKMKGIAEDYLGEEVSKAVITVPAYFNDAQRKATKDAGRIAGLNVMRVINEPTAAAIAYGLNTSKVTNYNKGEDKEDEEDEDAEDKVVLVYDLGGGTFDVSLLEINSGGVFEVKATSGNTFLGGEDFTQRLVQHFKAEILKRFGVESLHPKAERRLINACEKAKRDLSSTQGSEAMIELDELIPGGKDFNSKITRAKFESLCMDLFKKTTNTVKEVLKDADVNKEDVDEVVLIGGSTRIPKIRNMLKNLFQDSRVNFTINPDEAVACGAAIQAAILNGEQHESLEDTLLLDVNPLSLGMNLRGDVTKVVIERNSMIPIKKVLTGLANAATNATVLRCTIVEGERPMTVDNTILGSFRIEDVPPGPVGSQKFNVEFDLDTDGILTVTSTHLDTGRQHGITLDSSTSGRLTTEEINKLVKKAEDMRQIDDRESKRVLARSAVEFFCKELELELTTEQQPGINNDGLLKMARDNLDWLKSNSESSEVVYIRKLDYLREEVIKVRESCPSAAMNNNSYGAETQSLSSCLKEGQKAFDCDNYEKALNWYFRAFKQTTSEQLEEKCDAIEGIGKAYRGMATNQMLIQGCCPLDRIVLARTKIWKYLNQGASWLVFGLTIGSRCNVKMVAELAKIMDMIFDKVIKLYPVESQPEYVNEYVREFLQILQNLESLQYFGARDILMRSIVQYLLRATAKIEKLLDREMSTMDYGFTSTKEILMSLDELSEHIERLVGLETDARIYNVELRGKEFRRFVDTNRALTETIKILVDTEKVMKDIPVDEIDVEEKINIAFHLIDNIKQAKKNTKDNMKLFSKSKLLEGKLYHNLLFNEEKARNCYREVIDIALAQGYVLEPWFTKAQDLYQKLRAKLDKEDEAEVQNSRAQVMKELETEMKKLNGAKNLLLDEFVNFLFENFPPKHKKNAKKPKVEDLNDPAKKKKVYITLCSYYHPDKIDATKFGMKYKTLCEEIAKVVNERYGTNVKGM